MVGFVRMYACAHTQTTWGFQLSPSVGRTHTHSDMKSWKNPHQLKRSVHVDRTCVQSTFVQVFARLWVGDPG